MDRDVVETVAAFVTHAVVLAVIPFVPVLVGTRIINGLQDARVRWTPYAELLALGVGALAGALIIVHNFPYPSLTAGEIFRDGGFWDLTFQEFLSTRANPFAYSLAPVLPWSLSAEGIWSLGLLVSLLGGVVVYAPIVVFRSPRGVANGMRNLVIIVWGAYATVYVLCYGLWLLNKMNFWALLLLLLIVQASRSRSERVVLRLK